MTPDLTWNSSISIPREGNGSARARDSLEQRPINWKKTARRVVLSNFIGSPCGAWFPSFLLACLLEPEAVLRAPP